MHDTADFCHSQRARGLLDYLQSNSEGHWPIAADAGLERFAFDQFHGIEALAILFAVISHPSDIWMMNVRSVARFVHETRPRARILRHASVNELQRNRRIQDSIVNGNRTPHSSCARLKGQ